MIENETILEHEILRVIYVYTGLQIVGRSLPNGKTIPILKRDYSDATLHFGALVDILNNPTKYENQKSVQQINPYTEDIKITQYKLIEVSNAIDTLVYNNQVIDDGPKDEYKRLTDRKITLTGKGAIDYRNNFYLREKRKKELDLRQSNSVIKTNKYFRWNIGATILFGIIVTAIQIMTCNRDKWRDRQEVNKSYLDSLRQLQQSKHDLLFENMALRLMGDTSSGKGAKKGNIKMMTKLKDTSALKYNQNK